MMQPTPESAALPAEPDADTQEADEQKVQLLAMELEQSDDEDGPFMVQSRTEIKGLLQALLDQGGFVSIYFNQGADLVLSSILDFDEKGGLLLAAGSNPDTNRRALQSDKLVLMSSLNKIKIQFTIPAMDDVEHEGRDAFRVDIPAAVLRLQRREHFRLMLPLMPSVQCKMSLRQKGGGPIKNVVSQVVDISSGGVGMILPPLEKDLLFDVDTNIEKFTIELPETGTIGGSLRVRSIFEMTQTGAKRAGCGYLSMTSQMSSLIQRFIIKTERDRKALS